MNLPNGWLYDKEATYLAWLVRDVIGLEGSFLEIGSFHGRSTVAIGTEIKKLNACLYCIDIWNKKLTEKEEIERKKIIEGYRKMSIATVDQFFKGDSYFIFTENIKANGLDNTIVPIIGFSSTIKKIWKIPLRFIFIDGNHDYEYILEDCLWKRFLVNSGIICFHDYKKGWLVKKAVDETMNNDSNFKLLGKVGSIKAFKKLDAK